MNDVVHTQYKNFYCCSLRVEVFVYAQSKQKHLIHTYKYIPTILAFNITWDFPNVTTPATHTQNTRNVMQPCLHLKFLFLFFCGNCTRTYILPER